MLRLFKIKDSTLHLFKARDSSHRYGRAAQWLQVLPPGASKGSGVSRLLQELSVEPQNLMALGDGENDVEMLQVCSTVLAHLLHVARMRLVSRTAGDVVLTNMLQEVKELMVGL